MDREKVIKALEICEKKDCVLCPYTDWYGEYDDSMCDCTKLLAKDAIALLKEQEAVKPVRDEQTGRLWLCGKCGSYVGFEDNDPHDPNEFDKYCRECGRPVLWEGE